MIAHANARVTHQLHQAAQLQAAGQPAEAVEVMQDVVSFSKGIGDESFLKSTWRKIAQLVTGRGNAAPAYTSGKDGGGCSGPAPK